MADRIEVNTQWLRKCARDLQSVNQSLVAANSTLSRTRLRRDEGGELKVSLNLRLKMTGAAYSGRTALDDILQLEKALGALHASVEQFSQGAIRASELFEQAEAEATRLVQANSEGDASQTYDQGGVAPGANVPAAGPGENVNTGEIGTEEKTSGIKGPDWFKGFFKWIGEMGEGGKAISETALIIEKFVQGNAGVEDVLKYAAKMGKVTVKWMDWHKNYLSQGKGEYAKKLFGLEKYTSGTWNTGFTETFKGKFFNSVNWIFSGITSGIDNISEGLKKNYGADRVAVEWATETVADVALGAGATALATWAVGAVGGAAVATAPAWVPFVAVTAVAGVGLAGADWAFKNTIGGGEYGIVQWVGHQAGEGWEGLKKWAGSKPFANWKLFPG